MSRSLAELHEELARLIDSTGLTERKDEILSSAKPSVRLLLKGKAGEKSLSFTGGLPTNNEVVWPECAEGFALTHIAQIHLPDLGPFLPDIPLPSSGTLNFFVDVQEFRNGSRHDQTKGWRVIYLPEPDPAAVPRTENDEGYELASDWPDPEFPESPLSFAQDLTIPSFRSIEILPLRLEGRRTEAYDDLRNKLADWVDPADSVHRMFGHPDAVQGCMQRQAQFITHAAYLPEDVYSYYEHPRAAELMPGARDWLLLFQLDSNKTPAWMWGDWGRVYFWIKRDDLARSAFEKTWHFLQCH